MELSSEELARYSRQLILPGVGVEAQARLKAARVLVVGMGGLGSPASLYLAAAGVGTLGLADFDVVELNNLHRQVLHTTAAVGRAKVESARDTLRALNPHCNTRLHPEGIRAEDLPALFDDYDLIVDGSDNFATRYMVNDAAVLARRPLVYGSIFQFEGQASFFHPAAGAPCYRCLFPEMPDPATVPNCAQAGVVGALAGMIGSIQALEAIKWLTGLGRTLAGRLLVVDTLTMQPRIVHVKRDPHCPVCSPNARIRSIDAAAYVWQCEPEPLMSKVIQLSPREVHQRLQDEQPPVLLDVREPDELHIAQLPEAVHIPLRQLGENLDRLSKEHPIIVLCHHGWRSQSAARELAARGFKEVYNLKGGIDAWSTDVDPSVQRY